MPNQQRLAAFQIFTDTDPDVEQILIEQIRLLSPERKLQMMAELNANMRAMALAGLRSRHPTDDDAVLYRRLAELLLGPRLAEEAFGPLPKKKATGLAGTAQP